MKEGTRKWMLPVAGASMVALGLETGREMLSLTQVTYMPSVQQCIEEKNLYGPQSYNTARAECLEQIGIQEFTPVLDSISFATGYREN